MAAERQNVDVRILDALGTPYGYDTDPRGGVRLQSRPGPWNKHAENPVLDVGAPGVWEDEVVDEAKVVFDGQRYQMWYLGRRASGNPEGKLPVVVGHATSGDGLRWTKDVDNPVLGFGPTGSYDSLGIHAPFVLFDGQMFRMWYSAWRADPEGSPMWSINYASSPDGTTWTKAPHNPLMVEERDGRWDETYICEPSVLWNGDRFEMWYNGGSDRTAAGGHELRIGYASSEDGLEWQRLSEDTWVLDVGDPGTWDDFSVARPHVLYDGLRYWMWYEGHDGGNFRIGEATSQDGVHWTKDASSPVLDLGSSESWDALQVHEPYVLFDGRLYRMWYSGYDGEHLRVGLATASPLYAEQGVLLSAPIDGVHATTWRSLSWRLDLPAGTDVSVAVATSDDGHVWSRWTTVVSHSRVGENVASLAGMAGPAEGQAEGGGWPVARYLRYRLTLSTTDRGVSPVLLDVSVSEEALATEPSLAKSISGATASQTPIASGNSTATLLPSTSVPTSSAIEYPSPGADVSVPNPVQSRGLAATPVFSEAVGTSPDQQSDPHALYVLGAVAVAGVVIALGTTRHRSDGPQTGVGG